MLERRQDSLLIGMRNRLPTGRGSRTYLDDILASSSFFAPLRTGLNAQGGSPTPTFTRATTATVIDHDEVVRDVLSGEARFQGARRVRNYITNPESGTGWATFEAGSSTSDLTLNAGVAPDGTTTAHLLELVRVGADLPGVNIPQTCPIVEAGVGSVWLKSSDGASHTIAFRATTGIGITTLTVTPEWQRFSTNVLALTAASSNMQLWLNTAGDSIDLLIWHPQLEDVTGQSVQTPAEYVSVGVTSAPYHGVNVDGVKYFDRENGNTVSSNVVTEAPGAQIVESALYGYLAEGARTNLCLQSEDLGTTWINTGSTDSLNATTAPLGATTADKLEEDNSLGGHLIGNTITGLTTGTTYTASVWLKAAERSFAFILLSGNAFVGVNASVSVNLTTGAVSTGTGSPLNAITTTFPNGWFRISFSLAASATDSGVLSLYTSQDGVWANRSFTGTTGSGFYAWGAQLEAASFASSYIPTTTASVTRNADVLTYPASGNIGETEGTLYIEGRPQGTPIANQYILAISDGTSNEVIATFRNATTGNVRGLTLDGGVTQAAPAGKEVVAGTSFKVAFSYKADDFAQSTDGGAVQSDTSGTIPTIDTIYVGSLNGVSNFFGTVKNSRLWSRQLSDAVLQNITS